MTTVSIYVFGLNVSKVSGCGCLGPSLWAQDSVSEPLCGECVLGQRCSSHGSCRAEHTSAEGTTDRESLQRHPQLPTSSCQGSPPEGSTTSQQHQRSVTKSSSRETPDPKLLQAINLSSLFHLLVVDIFQLCTCRME